MWCSASLPPLYVVWRGGSGVMGRGESGMPFWQSTRPSRLITLPLWQPRNLGSPLAPLIGQGAGRGVRETLPLWQVGGYGTAIMAAYRPSGVAATAASR